MRRVEALEVDRFVEAVEQLMVVSDRQQRGIVAAGVIKQDVQYVIFVYRVEISRRLVAEQQRWL